MLGDFITEDLSSVLASTFDGNIDSLYNTIINSKINEYIRSAAFHTLEILEDKNIITKEKVIELIDKMLSEDLKEDDSVVITDIVRYIARKKVFDKIEAVRLLYAQYRVNTWMIGEWKKKQKSIKS